MPDASGVKPASARISMRLVSARSGKAPGLRTSPMTKTCWLWYSATATVTRGFLKYPSRSRARSVSSNCPTVLPAATTRPISGNEKAPSPSTVYRPLRSD